MSGAKAPQGMRVKLRQIESKDRRVGVNRGKETTDLLISTEHTDKNSYKYFSDNQYLSGTSRVSEAGFVLRPMSTKDCAYFFGLEM